MLTPRVASCLGLLILSALLGAQTPPISYTITQNAPTPGSTNTIYRNGSKALTIFISPAQGATPASRTSTLYDLAAGVNYSWNPDDKNVPCSANHFSGDWGDPFGMIGDVTKEIANGDIKPAGSETISGVATQVYAGTSQGAAIKVWLDTKDSLVVRASFGPPGGPMQTMVDITKVSFATPAVSLFALPAVCAGVKPPPTAAELIADETGDDAANYVSAFTGPGSKDSCNVVLRVVKAKTMTPLMPIQVGLDTQYDQNDPNPPHYEFGVADSGTDDDVWRAPARDHERHSRRNGQPWQLVAALLQYGRQRNPSWPLRRNGALLPPMFRADDSPALHLQELRPSR